MEDIKDYYCSQKFWWLSVDLEKRETLSCCSSLPAKIDFTHLSINPGSLFNSPDIINERKLMLENKFVKSCSPTCWNAEEKGLLSRRLQMQSQIRTHSKILNDPETLGIIVGSDCNMTCSYCCKQYSSKWLQDLTNYGEYPVTSEDNRYQLTKKDKILSKLSQKQLSGSEFNKQILKEIQLLSEKQSLTTVDISGGETFLYLDLENLIKVLPKNLKVNIWTGLGVDPSRFNKELDKLSKHRDIHIVVSAENIESFYEFNRYGNSWQRFLTNLEHLQLRKIEYSFNSTITNLTIFGLLDFEKFAAINKINYNCCTDPDFLNISVLDQKTKDYIIDNLEHYSAQSQHIIKENIFNSPTPLQIKNFKNFIHTYVKRRNLDLQIFPTNFFNWIKNEH